MSDLQQVSWPLSRSGEAMMALASARWLTQKKEQSLHPPAHLLNAAQQDVTALHEWVEAAADYAGLEAEPVDVSYIEVESLVRGASPMLLLLPNQQLLALLKGNARAASVLSPSLQVQWVKIETICAELRRPHETPLQEKLNQWLEHARVAPSRQPQARRAILREQLGPKTISGGWLLRLPPGASFWQQLRQAKLLRAMCVPIVMHIMHYVLLLAAWWMLGRGALNGQFDRGWFVAWALLLGTAVPFHILAVRAQGRFAIGAGALLKQRLLYGALRLDPEAIRQQGTGQLLGQVSESNAIETLALNGGFQAIVAAIELAMAMVVFSASTNPVAFWLLLAGNVTAVLFLTWCYFQRRRSWMTTRMALTNDLVERMVGHRTRLAQDARHRWHEGEDQAIEGYLAQSLKLDRADVWQALAPRGWLLISLCGVALTFVGGSVDTTALAVTIGGVLLGFRGLQKLVTSLNSLLGAVLSWEQIAEIFKAAANEQPTGAPDFAIRSQASLSSLPNSPVILEARHLTFRYRERGQPVLRDCTLQVRAGERLLLQGSSGGGKSTLAALLAGLRQPESGLLLVGGLDYETIGASGWRKRVVAAPQFHENHIITGTLAFNLLLGRGWPPTHKDLQQAEEVCHALGLGELLDRMPAGMLQMIGETGWQLSHGERSRLFMARALLQGTELVILDESFGALDPNTMQRSLQCALHRAPTLCVIAHP